MQNYTWILKAVVLGFFFFLSVFLIKPLGGSSPYSIFAGIIHSAVEPDVITVDTERDSGYKSSVAYYDKNGGWTANAIKEPLDFDFVGGLSIILGGFIGWFVIFRRKNTSEMSDLFEDKSLPPEKQNWVRKYVPSIVGGFLILYGARMADGCTSSHMMSGLMQSSISGFFFAGGVFATAIPTAILLKKYTRGGK